MNKKQSAAALLMSLMAIGIIINAVASVWSSTAQNPPEDEYPTVSFTPQGVQDLNVGEPFTVTVTVSKLTDSNLYGFDLNFTWNTNAVQYVSHETEIPVETHAGGVLHEPIVQIMDQIDESRGTLWLAYASLLPASAFNENGIIFTVTFILLQPSDNPYAIEHVILVNNKGDLIPQNGSQKPENLFSGSATLTEYQVLRIQKWLDWWTHISQSGARRRPSAAP